MGTVRVTCGHLEEGKRVVCEGCFKALESKLAQVEKERDEFKQTCELHSPCRHQLETAEVMAQRDKYREALKQIQYCGIVGRISEICESALSDGKEGV